MRFMITKGFKYTVRCSLHDASTADDGVFFLQIDDILDSNGKSVVAAGGKLEDYVKFANAKGRLLIQPLIFVTARRMARS